MKNEDEIMELNDEDSTEIFSLEEGNPKNLVDDTQSISFTDNNLFSTYDENEDSNNLKDPIIEQAIISDTMANPLAQSYKDESTQNVNANLMGDIFNGSSVTETKINNDISEPIVGAAIIQSESSITDSENASNKIQESTDINVSSQVSDELVKQDIPMDEINLSMENEINSMTKNNTDTNNDSKSNLIFILVFGIILLVITFLLPYISGYK